MTIAIETMNTAQQAAFAGAVDAATLAQGIYIPRPGVLNRGRQQISGRCQWPLSNVSGQATTSYRARFVAAFGVGDPSLIFFTGYGTNGNFSENLSISPVTFSAAIEYPRGVVTQVSLNGETKITRSAGQFVALDPASLNIPAGATFWVRTTAFQAGGLAWPLNFVSIFAAGNNGQDGDGIGPRMTNATNASPIVISTSGEHNFQTGDTATISGVGGNTAANGTFTVTRINSTSFSLNGTTGNGTFSAAGIVLGSDMTLPGSGQMAGTGGSAIFTPIAVVGTPLVSGAAAPWAAILLDSIARGSGETLNALEGWVARGLGGAFAPTVPYINVSIPGLTSAQFADPNAAPIQSEKRRRLILSAPYLINNGGTNDWSAGATWQQIAGYNLAIATDAKARRSRVIQATLLPKTTSSDSWSTAGNQTTTTGEATVRVPYNQWLRAGAPIIAGAAVAPGTSGAILAGQDGHPFWKVIDPAALVEVNASNVLAQDGGRWLTNGTANYPTTDGTHPTSALHIIASGAVSAIVPEMAAF